MIIIGAQDALHNYVMLGFICQGCCVLNDLEDGYLILIIRKSCKTGLNQLNPG